MLVFTCSPIYNYFIIINKFDVINLIDNFINVFYRMFSGGSRMMYEKLDYVLAIAEEGNLTKAAKRLFISQPTLSMYLNRLEESLGVTLFDRHKNPIRLTEAGAYYLKCMKKIAEAEQLLRTELHSIANPMSNFTIGIGRVRGHHWLPPLMRELTDLYPNVSFQSVQNSEHYLLDNFHSLNLDVLIGSFSDAVLHSKTGKKLQMCRRILSQESLLWVAHKRYHLVPDRLRNTCTPRNPYIIKPEMMDHLPFITSSISTSLYSTFDMMMNLYHITPGRILYLDNMSTGLSLVAEGLGVQLINTSILMTLGKHYDPTDLDYILLPNMNTTRACYLLWASDTEKLPLINSADHILRDKVLTHLPFNEIISEENAITETL
jgi:DNA-binding transcriptional LysR family regulator